MLYARSLRKHHGSSNREVIGFCRIPVGTRVLTTSNHIGATHRSSRLRELLAVARVVAPRGSRRSLGDATTECGRAQELRRRGHLIDALITLAMHDPQRGQDSQGSQWSFQICTPPIDIL